MSEVLLDHLDSPHRKRLLLNYLSAAAAIASAELPDRPYGELLLERPITDKTWRGFISKVVDERLSEHSSDLNVDAGFGRRKISSFLAAIQSIPESPRKCLVHGDFYPANVMVGDDLNVTGVLDFSPMTVVGDPQVDIAGSLMWLEVVAGYREEDSRYLRDVVSQKYETPLAVLEFYRIFYSIYFAGAKEDDPKLYEWCVSNLRAWKGATT